MKKDYFKPAMRVVEVKHRCNILAGSNLYHVNSNLGTDDFCYTGEGSTGNGR